jgi:predicted ArsR family transcriptional regulator
MAVGAIVARILTQYSDKGTKSAIKDINKMDKKFKDFANKSAKVFGVAALAAAAFAAKIGKDAVQGAMEDQKQQTALATALRNVTGATDEAIAATQAYLDKQELMVGVDNKELFLLCKLLYKLLAT